MRILPLWGDVQDANVIQIFSMRLPLKLDVKTQYSGMKLNQY